MLRLLGCSIVAFAIASVAVCEERSVDPTFLRRSVAELSAKTSDLTAAGSRYKPIFGAGTPDGAILRGIARYGELTVDAGASSAQVSYPDEEQVYMILDGAGVVAYGDEKVPVKKDDFLYLPPGVRHGVSNPSEAPCRLIVMGWRIPKGTKITAPSKPQTSNLADVPKQTVAGHPPTTLYQLLMGDLESKRDKIAAGHVLTSLFIMEFAPGGTNFPHHHEDEEEIYLVLDGNGDMAAGSGMNGVEGRFPAKAGDAYFFRLNCTVGFYSKTTPGSKSHILAVRSRFPFSRR